MTNNLLTISSGLAAGRRLGLAMLLLWLAGCASNATRQALWPADIPEREHYLALYEADSGNQQAQSRDDYLKWVKRFYRGWALSPYSWDWLTRNALEETTDPEDYAKMRELLSSIGARISGEWAKDSAHRQINSAHLLTWGDALKLATKRGQQVDLGRRISSDVDQLLAEELQPHMIDFDRYFPENNNIVAADDTEFDDFDVF